VNRLILFLLSFTLFSSNFALAEKGEVYYDQEEFLEYDERFCSIEVIVIVDRFFTSESDARSLSGVLDDLFETNSSVRWDRGRRRWHVGLNNVFKFQGRGKSWTDSRRDVFNRYFNWANKRGFGYDFIHRIRYASSCSG